MPTSKRPDLTLTNEQIIEYCKDKSDAKLLSCAQYSNTVVRLNAEVAVKHGFGISQTEAINQIRAYEMLDPSIARVPYVYRFFMDKDERGYLVMELISGDKLDCMGDRELSTILRVINHLATFKRNVPGPANYDPPRGLLFSSADDDTPAFKSMSELEAWWNLRLRGKSTLSICDLQPVLCHLDIAPRNIIWQTDGIPTLLDWESAGYYPHFFEYCSQMVMGGEDIIFSSKLAEMMARGFDGESTQARQILSAWWNMQKYTFQRHPKTKPDFSYKIPVPDLPLPSTCS